MNLLIEKGSIGVGGNLISRFEQPVAMRSIPYSATFRQASQLPAEFKMLHTEGRITTVFWYIDARIYYL